MTRQVASPAAGLGTAPVASGTSPAWGPTVVAVLPAALALVLFALWIGPSGLRGAHWQAPAPLSPDLSVPALSSLQAAGGAGDADAFGAILERPIFSPSRKPPPPVVVAVVVPPPPPDPLEKVRILGVFSGALGNGVIAEIDGKARRLMVGDAIDPWKLSAVSAANVTFVQGSQTRVLSLVKPQKSQSPGPATYVQGGVVKAPPLVLPAKAVGGTPAAGGTAAGNANSRAPVAAPTAASPPATSSATSPRAPGLPIPMPDGSLRMP